MEPEQTPEARKGVATPSQRSRGLGPRQVQERPGVWPCRQARWIAGFGLLSLGAGGITHETDPRSQSAPRMLELLGFISSLITLYIYIIIAGAVMSWLIAFNVVNPYNPFVRSVWQAMNALTEPLLRPIRRWMPDLGGIDISPVVLILACAFVQSVVLPNIAKLVV